MRLSYLYKGNIHTWTDFLYIEVGFCIIDCWALIAMESIKQINLKELFAMITSSKYVNHI